MSDTNYQEIERNRKVVEHCLIEELLRTNKALGEAYERIENLSKLVTNYKTENEELKSKLGAVTVIDKE